MHPKGILASIGLIALVRIASAQEAPTDTPEPTPAPTPAPAADPPPPPSTTKSSSASFGTDDSNIGTAFGVGAQAMLTGPVGPALVYNASRFHIEGLFAFSDVNDTSSFTVAGRAWLHIHTSDRASLSLGGGGGILSTESEPEMVGGRSESSSSLIIEGGAQIRFFATRNVAISASAGLGIVSGDSDTLAVTGQLTGAFGITYFIF